MISIEEAVDQLCRPDTYHFRPLLEDLASCMDDHKRNVINTVELFAFGLYKLYRKHQPEYLQLLKQGVAKLEMLSVLTVASKNVGNNVPMAEFLGEMREGATVNDLELLLIRMVDSKVLSVSIDEEQQQVAVSDALVLRDAYNPETYVLRVLSESDVASTTWATRQLQQWLAQQVAPAVRTLRA